MEIAALLDKKREEMAQFEDISQMWLGADFDPLEKRWKWTDHYQDFNAWSNWESKAENIGCFSSGCTKDDGLILRPDSGYSWNAVVDKSLKLPYVCLSRCKKGYQWFPSKRQIVCNRL